MSIEPRTIDAPVNVKPQGGGGGGGLPTGIWLRQLSPGTGFWLWALPVGREFDMAAILDGRENLEMSHRAKDLYCFFALFWSFFRHRFRHERTKGKQICFIFPQILAVAYF